MLSTSKEPHLTTASEPCLELLWMCSRVLLNPALNFCGYVLKCCNYHSLVLLLELVAVYSSKMNQVKKQVATTARASAASVFDTLSI